MTGVDDQPDCWRPPNPPRPNPNEGMNMGSGSAPKLGVGIGMFMFNGDIIGMGTLMGMALKLPPDKPQEFCATGTGAATGADHPCWTTGAGATTGADHPCLTTGAAVTGI